MAAAAAAVDRSAMGLDLEFRLLHGVGFQIRAPMGWTWCSISMASSASARPSASFCYSSRHAPMLPLVWAPDARQAVDAPDLKAGRATLAAPAPAMLNFAPGQLPQK
ncbi:hypothetical protein VPH35_010685 [Triticum aestivum]